MRDFLSEEEIRLEKGFFLQIPLMVRRNVVMLKF